MCTTPSIPTAPAPIPPAPPAPSLPPPTTPTPPPELVDGGTDAPVKQQNTARQKQQQVSQGANNLRIPLSTGSSTAAPAKKGLSIPK